MLGTFAYFALFRGRKKKKIDSRKRCKFVVDFWQISNPQSSYFKSHDRYLRDSRKLRILSLNYPSRAQVKLLIVLRLLRFFAAKEMGENDCRKKAQKAQR
jgi:hypothetical protein